MKRSALLLTLTFALLAVPLAAEAQETFSGSFRAICF
jgi:hypothetical protein